MRVSDRTRRALAMRLDGSVGFALLAVLTGCAPSPPAPAVGLPDTAFPAHVARFDLVEAPMRGRVGVTAGYQLDDPDNVVIATVHVTDAGGGGSLLPSLDRGVSTREQAAAEQLARGIAEVRRFYPDARVGPARDVFLTRDGGLRMGREVTLQYDELFAGRVQPIDLDIEVVCCTADHAAYEYRFRHPANVAADPAATSFVEALPWAVAAPAGATSTPR